MRGRCPTRRRTKQTLRREDERSAKDENDSYISYLMGSQLQVMKWQKLSMAACDSARQLALHLIKWNILKKAPKTFLGLVPKVCAQFSKNGLERKVLVSFVESGYMMWAILQKYEILICKADSLKRR